MCLLRHQSGAAETVTPVELASLYEEISAKYPIVSIEDPFDQDDWDAWADLTARIGDRVQVVGDDLLVTNPTRIAEATTKNACNALLLKVGMVEQQAVLACWCGAHSMCPLCVPR